MFSLNHFFQLSSSSGSAPNKTNSAKHLGQGFITRGRSISWKKENICHLEAITSVSLLSCKLNLPTDLIRPLLVAKIARLFDLSIRRSDANWFLGRGKCTVWPSSSNKKSLHAILSGEHRKSLRKATYLFSRLVQEYFVFAGLTNALKISSNGSNRKDFPQLVGPTIKMLLFFCLPFIRAFLMAQTKKYWFCCFSRSFLRTWANAFLCMFQHNQNSLLCLLFAFWSCVTGLAGARDTQMFSSNFFFFSLDTWLNLSKAFFVFGDLMHSKGVCPWLCNTVKMYFSFIIYQ